MRTPARPARRRGYSFCTLLVIAFASSRAEAQSPDPSELLRVLNEARAEIAAQSARIAAQQQLLDEQRRRIDAIAAELQRTRPAEPAAPVEAAQAPVPRVGVEVAAAAPSIDAQTVSAQPLLLTPPGVWVAEPSLQYSYVSTNQISIVGFTVVPAITVGLIDVQRVARNTLTAAIGLRYGLSPRVELEARLPYVYRNDSSVARPLNTAATEDVTVTTTGQGIGDLEGAVRYQLPWLARTGGGLIGELRVKSRTGTGPLEVPTDALGLPTKLPTGTGFWSVQPGITAVVPSDPAVLYGGLSYQWNVARNYGGAIGNYNPGDGVDANAGIGLALNDRSSFSIGYDHLWLGRNEVNGMPVPGTLPVQVGRLLLGYSHRVGERTRVQASLAIGVTSAAPDVQFTLRVPTAF